MLLYFIRGLFVVIIAAVLFAGITSITDESAISADDPVIASQNDVRVIFVAGLGLAIVVLLIDWLLPRKSLTALAGVFLGLLVGIFISWALSQVLDMVNSVFRIGLTDTSLGMSKWVMGICISYLAISFVMRTKDDIRFVIPYVEFSRQTKGIRPLVLDTSVIIDGRIADISNIKLFDSPLIIPKFVLNELQLIADSADKLKRVRGRRGLDVLHRLQESSVLEVIIDDTPPPGVDDATEVDQKLVAFTKNCDGKLVTNDYNLNKVAQLREVDVININDLANAMKAIVLPGEPMEVKIVKAGEEAEQGIAYLDDGTMIVIENGRRRIGEQSLITVTSALQTSAGRMIFGKYERPANSARKNGSNDQRNKRPDNQRGNR